MSIPQPSALIAFVLATTTLPAGNVLRVGPSRAFATIQAAVDAAQSGDVVLVDPGSYAGFVIGGRALAVLPASLGAITLQAAPGQPAVTVRGIPAGQNVTLASLRIAYAEPGAPAVAISANTGAVRIADLDVDLAVDLLGVAHQAAVEVDDSATVWFEDLRVSSAAIRHGSTRNPIGPNDGLSAIAVARSHVVMRRYVLSGYSTPPGARYGGDAVRLRAQSVLWLLHDPSGSGFLTGGSGGDYGGNCMHLIATPAATLTEVCGFLAATAGIGRLRNGGLYAHNDDGGLVRQGGSTFVRLFETCLESAAGVTTIVAPTVAPGGAIDVDVSARFSNRLQLLYLAASARMLNLKGHGVEGNLLFDAPSGTLADARFATGPTRLQFALPALPALVGLQLTAQALLGPPGGASVPSASLTFPAMVVVTP